MTFPAAPTNYALHKEQDLWFHERNGKWFKQPACKVQSTPLGAVRRTYIGLDAIRPITTRAKFWVSIGTGANETDVQVGFSANSTFLQPGQYNAVSGTLARGAQSWRSPKWEDLRAADQWGTFVNWAGWKLKKLAPHSLEVVCESHHAQWTTFHWKLAAVTGGPEHMLVWGQGQLVLDIRQLDAIRIAFSNPVDKGEVAVEAY